jgi:hypothetical protein
MATLDSVMEPPFECNDDDARDTAFVKATCIICGRDVVEEYMACGLFPLSVSFGLGEIAKGECRCQSWLRLCRRSLLRNSRKRRMTDLW